MNNINLKGLDYLDDLPDYSLMKTVGMENEGKYYFLESENAFNIDAKTTKRGLVEIEKSVMAQTTVIIAGESKAFISVIDGYVTSIDNLIEMGVTLIKCNEEQ